MVICLERGADLHTASWCHCHSLCLASVKSRLVLPFWYRLTWVVPDKGPLNVCVTVFTERFRAAVSVLIGPCCPALPASYSRKCAYSCIIGQIKWWWWWWWKRKISKTTAASFVKVKLPMKYHHYADHCHIVQVKQSVRCVCVSVYATRKLTTR